MTRGCCRPVPGCRSSDCRVRAMNRGGRLPPICGHGTGHSRMSRLAGWIAPSGAGACANDPSKSGKCGLGSRFAPNAQNSKLASSITNCWVSVESSSSISPYSSMRNAPKPSRGHIQRPRAPAAAIRPLTPLSSDHLRATVPHCRCWHRRRSRRLCRLPAPNAHRG